MNSGAQRVHPDGLVDMLLSTFGMGAIEEFRRFLAGHPLVTKWIVATDFVIGEPQAASDAYAYTFFPYDAEIQELKDRIVRLVPKDFKKIKTVKPELGEFFRSGDTFTICLLTPKKYRIAGDIDAVRRGLDATLRMMRNWNDAGAQTEIIRAFERLQEKAKANNFSAQLMSTTMIATVLAAFCAIVLARERAIEIVGWFPDRDDITTSHERIAEYMFGANFSAFCQRHGIDERPIKTTIGRPEPDVANPRRGWYDELVRIPDCIAGPLAGWHYKRNLAVGRQKYAEILQGAVADNPYITILLLQNTDEGIGVSRLLCSKNPFPMVGLEADR
jgi:hypothetical protein